MATQLSRESGVMLQGYIAGQISNGELAEWLAQVEYDSDLTELERDALARIQLLVIEVQEKRRKPSAILEGVAETLAASTDEGITFAYRTGSATSWQGEPRFSAAPSRLQRVGI